MAAQHLALDSFWLEKPRYDEAERLYYEKLSNATLTPLADEVAKARQRLNEIRGNIDDTGSKQTEQKLQQTPVVVEQKVVEEQKKNVVQAEQKKVEEKKVVPVDKKSVLPATNDKNSKTDVVEAPTAQLTDMAVSAKFFENKMEDFYKLLTNIQSELSKFEARLTNLESRTLGGAAPACQKPAHVPACKKPEPANNDDDDDVDLFGSDSEDDETAAKLKEERLAAYNAKKSKKPALIAKSSIILDIKPWDDETDMKAMETEVRKITMDGLLWGASKLVPLAYGIHKLQINCVVEDDKVSIDQLQEDIEKIEDYVQSVDIAAFNKI